MAGRESEGEEDEGEEPFGFMDIFSLLATRCHVTRLWTLRLIALDSAGLINNPRGRRDYPGRKISRNEGNESWPRRGPRERREIVDTAFHLMITRLLSPLPPSRLGTFSLPLFLSLFLSRPRR